MDGLKNSAFVETRGIAPSLLDASLPTPLYHQVYLALRDRIRNGGFAAHSLLPGELPLSRQFAVSRITVKRALNELAAEGLISRHRGRGSLVTSLPPVPVVRANFLSLIESLREMGLRTEVRLIEALTLDAEPAIAHLLNLPAGARIQRAIRLRSLNGEPFSYLLTYIPESIAKGYTRKELARLSFLTLLEKAGADATEAEQWISAVAADSTIAGALAVPTGAPLLKIERIMRDKDGRAIQLIYAHYRSDRFHYHVKTSKRLGQNPTWKVAG